jgi:hypothetical protein
MVQGHEFRTRLRDDSGPLLATSEWCARQDSEPLGTSVREWRRFPRADGATIRGDGWCARQDSNLRPLAPEANALSS